MYMFCVFLTIETLVSQCHYKPVPFGLLQGSYGRLGLGNSENQPNLRSVGTFSANTVIRKIVSSKGSDGHSMAITADGQVLSWGDGECCFHHIVDIRIVQCTAVCYKCITSGYLHSGNYGKLGHGDIATQKTPKIISAFTGKVQYSIYGGTCAVYHRSICAHVHCAHISILLMLSTDGDVCSVWQSTQRCSDSGGRALHVGRGWTWQTGWVGTILVTFLLNDNNFLKYVRF